jgi:ATP-binding protein involved in chromosome partitioning
MKIAIPLANGLLCMHFGHCAQFAIIDVDEKKKEIIKREDVTPPPHEPGLLPKWLNERDVNFIIAGGMGSRAQTLFTQNNISVIVGAPAQSPEQLLIDFLNGELQSGTNVCDH